MEAPEFGELKLKLPLVKWSTDTDVAGHGLTITDSDGVTHCFSKDGEYVLRSIEAEFNGRP